VFYHLAPPLPATTFLKEGGGLGFSSVCCPVALVCGAGTEKYGSKN